MISFKFEYPTKPSEQYLIKYGLDSKSRPYFFDYPVGLSGGKYRFDYDRRDGIHIEDTDASIAKWASDIEIERQQSFVKQKNDAVIEKQRDFVKWGSEAAIEKQQSFVKWGSDMGINNEHSFVKWANSLEINLEAIIETTIKSIIINANFHLQAALKEIERSQESVAEKTNKKIETGQEFHLNPTYKELQSSKEYVFDMAVKEIIKNIDEVLLHKMKRQLADFSDGQELNRKEVLETYQEIELGPLEKQDKEVHISCALVGLQSGLQRLLITSDNNILGSIIKVLEIETERLLDNQKQADNQLYINKHDFKADTNFNELDSESCMHNLDYDLQNGINTSEDMLVYANFVNDLEYSRHESKLFATSKDVFFELVILLYKAAHEVQEIGENNIAHKVLREIIRLDVFQTVQQEFVRLEFFEGQELEKDFESDMSIYEAFKEMANTAQGILEDLAVEAVENISSYGIDIEGQYKLLDEIREFIAEIESAMKQLNNVTISELYEKPDIFRLIKEIVVHDMAIEDEFIDTVKEKLRDIELEELLRLTKSYLAGELGSLEISTPVEKGLKEITTGKPDMEVFKETIGIDISREEEFKKVIGEIEKDIEETKIKFNKRFWFLRATDPFDWKVLPYSDYPYSSKPIAFDNEAIPDNWQLDMLWVPRLHEGIAEHPMPLGSSLGKREMEVSVEIMIDVINIMILIWSRMFYNFSGYTGSQAVIRFTKLLYDWLMLETSIDEMESKGSKEHYFRCYNWVRWEAEKVAIKARDDMSLSGNIYIDEWIFELIYYMENHHFDTMPIFDVVQKMDEYRALLPIDDPQGDINFVLDKVKGMRHKIIECKTNKSNE